MVSKVYVDLHIHSRYSRATSKNISINTLEKAARLKGLNVLGTGDFTHPSWISELKRDLTEIENTGIYQTKNGFNFIHTTEISLIYSQGGKGRRIHIILLAPNFEIVTQINDWLKTKGRVDYDGRPIFGFSCQELVENMMGISKDIMIIPAHCMTPWYGILGSKSGFDSVEECFQDQTKYIYALETGLSADPEMLWEISSLDKFALISNSDSHSANIIRLGREFNAFALERLTYKEIINAIKNKDKKKFLFTGEVPPSLGKYHFDGHRNCGISFSPKETRKHKGMCPICKKPLTIGVEYRVKELADRPEGYKPENAVSFKSLIPLAELIASLYKTQAFTKKVQNDCELLIQRLGSELNVLLETPEEEIKSITNEKIALIIMLNRKGKIKVRPGYDGVYGNPIIPGGGGVYGIPIPPGRKFKINTYTHKQKSLEEF